MCVFMLIISLGALTATSVIINSTDNITISGTIVSVGPIGLYSTNITLSGVVNSTSALEIVATQFILTPAGYTTSKNFSLNSTTALLSSGAWISVDGGGFTGPLPGVNGLGPGGGIHSATQCTGAGHGGSGGGSLAAGGVAYDSIFTPNQPGSSGCAVSTGTGGSGGGIATLFVDTLNLDAKLTARGLFGSPDASGGSGGSIYIRTQNCSGVGLLNADGGIAGSLSGGGAGISCLFVISFPSNLRALGGRIALYYGESSYIGAFSAVGGSGSLSGGPGIFPTS